MIMSQKLANVVAICAIASVLLLSNACAKTNGAASPPRPPEVIVAKVEQRDVPIYTEWIGTLDGMVNADVKAQVAGYLLTKNYNEGSFVKKNQLLFQIDPRPLQASLDQASGQLAQAQGQLGQANAQLLQAKANLAQVEANQRKTQLDVERYTPLAKAQAVTQQDLDNAVQTNLGAEAQVKASAAGVETAKAAITAAKSLVESATAAVRTAKLNLGFTRIVSPIDGIAGIAPAQVGDLVSPSAQALTTVSTVDPIKVYFTVSEQEYLDYTKRNSTEGDSIARPTELELVLADGTVYPRKGKFYAADRNVDAKTGSIRLAGLFPNPGNVLRPGQYGKVRSVTTIKQGALLVPQRAVSELQGSYRVAVLGPGNKVSIRPVKVGDRFGSMWIIEAGLKPDEDVVVEGGDKARPDTVVTPKQYIPPPESSPSPGGASGH
ncbi:MAG TPA: efflux RND transporter periplasmic adaptor subunit [Blastocatellia bacterium]|nr:efflux RND transporter periplasmic adaptor subunit [Blastocatellia bacterium]